MRPLWAKTKKNYIFPHVDSISLSRCELACCSNVLKTNFELTSKEFKIKIHFRDDSLAKDLCWKESLHRVQIGVFHGASHASRRLRWRIPQASACFRLIVMVHPTSCTSPKEEIARLSAGGPYSFSLLYTVNPLTDFGCPPSRSIQRRPPVARCTTFEQRDTAFYTKFQ